MRARLLPVLLLCASSAAAQTAKVGCTPVDADLITEERLEREYKPLLKGEGAAVAVLKRTPGVEWDLGEKRTVRLSVYLTRACALGLTSSAVSGWESSSPNLNDAVQDFARKLRADAPDWEFSVVPPNTFELRKGETLHTTDLRKLLDVRLAAATRVSLNGVPVRVLYDGWLLFIVPENAEKSVNLSVRSTVHPWAAYDLAPYGLPRIAARFDEGKAVIWALPQ